VQCGVAVGERAVGRRSAHRGRVDDARRTGDDTAELLAAAESLHAAWTTDGTPREMRGARRQAADQLLDVLRGSPATDDLRLAGVDLTDWRVIQPGWFLADGPTDFVLGFPRPPGRSSVAGQSAQTLPEHSEQVAALTAIITGSRSMPDHEAAAVVLAALHHDDGKTRPEWQRLMYQEQPVNPAVLLAKSGATLSRTENTAAMMTAGLEQGWRHEALSAAMLSGSNAPDLAVHLAGSHHGRGRPFYPLITPQRAEQNITATGGQRFADLTQRYGPGLISVL